MAAGSKVMAGLTIGLSSSTVDVSYSAIDSVNNAPGPVINCSVNF